MYVCMHASILYFYENELNYTNNSNSNYNNENNDTCSALNGSLFK